MFDIQDCKFNKTITAVEPNFVLSEFWHERLMETKDDFKRVEICENSIDVLELYTERGYIRISKAEAMNIAKHFGFDVVEATP